ncbi:MAG: hypothetical protein GXP24_13800 [Planctomycetes bacterium]|nr:hypothetical protein [Planctomycetota bacterium]
MNKLQLAVVLLALSVATDLYAQQSRPLYQATQQALDTLSRAEIARENSKRGHSLETVRKQFRLAILQIREIEGKLADLLRQAYQQKPSQRDKDDWTVRELESLARNLKLQLARAYRNQALCYPVASPDRINALSLALEQLPEIITLPLNDASVWQARLEQIVCLRLLKKHSQATKLIERWQSASPPANIASRLANEKIYLDLESGNLTYALAHKDPALLRYAAASLYSRGELVEAVATYDRIATLEAAQGHANRKFQALKTAAAIVRERKRPGEALVRFRKLALQKPPHDEDASVHLIAIGIAAELARDATAEGRGETFDQYVILLKEHLQQWPKAPSARKVQLWLTRSELPEIDRQRAQKLANQGNRRQALALYRKLITDAPNDAKLLETYAQLLATGKDKTELQEALRVWQTLEKRSKPGGPRWWRGRRARLALLDSLGEGGQAKKLRQLTKILYE